MRCLMVLLLSGCLGAISLLAQAPDNQDLWRSEKEFERAITTKQYDAARPMFHADFLGVDADGSGYTADAYLARRAGESLFFDIEDEPYPGGGIAIGTVLIGSSVQRFSHVWLQTPQGWRLVAAQASTIGPRANASPGATRPSSGDETDHIKDQANRSAAESAIIDALRRVQRAEHAKDVSAWAALTDDHFWAISPFGSRDPKSARMGQIGQLTAGPPLPTVHDVQIHIYGDLAIMSYVQEPFNPPAMRGTRLWVRHGVVWQQALNHQTRITQPASK
jgi:ketosteroid isomerase-like protein